MRSYDPSCTRHPSGLSAKQLAVLCLPSTSLAVFRLLDVPLRVRVRRRALRGTPLPAHTTPPFHRQTTVVFSARQLAVLCLPSTSLAVFRLLDVPLRVRVRRRALRGTPLPAHTTPPFHRQTTVVFSARQLAVLCLPSTSLAVFRLLDVPLRVRVRRRALRGTPLPAHITPPFHRQTTSGPSGRAWRSRVG